MNQFFITVVIPTHCRPKLLEAALRSVAAQSLSRDKFEVVVVASPDDPGRETALATASETGLAVRCVTVPNDPTKGRSASAKRNYGGQLARGDWLAFLDDDCVATPEWLLEGAKCFPGQVAVEGAKRIPEISPQTLTYKGLKSFERPGGYQSCNMFYRRDVFLEVGGFDLRFPFYLEDTDLAWTILSRGSSIPHAAQSIVSHPVVPPAPWRLLDDAKRTVLLALLRAKHPLLYQERAGRLLTTSHWLHLIGWLATLLLTIFFGLAGGGIGLLLQFMLMCADSFRIFRGCRVTRHEVFITTLLLPVVPLIRVVQYVRGRWRYRGTVPPQSSLFQVN